jgi:hypothetical protein
MADQVKIFSATNDPKGLEAQVNQWFQEQNGKIAVTSKDVVASGRMDQTVTITIWYKQLHDGG